MALAPIPTPEVLWRKPPVLALAALQGRRSAVSASRRPSPAAWAAAGAAARMLHDAPLPPGPAGAPMRSRAPRRRMRVARHQRRPSGRPGHAQPPGRRGCAPAVNTLFAHGDLQVAHVFIDGDQITGVIDWTEAGPGDALYDLASLTLGHQEHLGDVVHGYGTDVDLGVIRAGWSLRSLLAARWLIEHGFDPSSPGCEFDVLRSQL